MVQRERIIVIILILLCCIGSKAQDSVMVEVELLYRHRNLQKEVTYLRNEVAEANKLSNVFKQDALTCVNVISDKEKTILERTVERDTITNLMNKQRKRNNIIKGIGIAVIVVETYLLVK